jgi:hypothetical protein
MPVLFTLSHSVVLNQRAEGPAFDTAVGGPGYLRGQAALRIAFHDGSSIDPSIIASGLEDPLAAGSCARYCRWNFEEFIEFHFRIRKQQRQHGSQQTNRG